MPAEDANRVEIAFETMPVAADARETDWGDWNDPSFTASAGSYAADPKNLLSIGLKITGGGGTAKSARVTVHPSPTPC